MVWSVGLTSKTCVVHPPPAANCGKTIELVDDDVIGATGSVVIRKSERSFIKPRSAIAATGEDDVKVNDCAVESPLNGGSSRNDAICAFPGRIVVPLLKFTPFLSVK